LPRIQERDDPIHLLLAEDLLGACQRREALGVGLDDDADLLVTRDLDVHLGRRHEHRRHIRGEPGALEIEAETTARQPRARDGRRIPRHPRFGRTVPAVPVPVAPRVPAALGGGRDRERPARSHEDGVDGLHTAGRDRPEPVVPVVKSAAEAAREAVAMGQPGNAQSARSRGWMNDHGCQLRSRSEASDGRDRV